MNEIAELERRIAAAMDRIGQGVEQATARRGAGAASDEDLREARTALEVERRRNAELSARLGEMRERQQGVVGQLEARVAELDRQLDAHSAEVQRLKTANRELMSALEGLREAPGEPVRGDAALRAALGALKAERRADALELDEILAALRPIIAEASHA